MAGLWNATAQQTITGAYWMPAFAGMTVELWLHRNRLPHALGKRALIDQFAKGHVFKRNTKRLEQRQLGR
jgi:hypothetical protein